MSRKELTKTFMMISNLKKQCLYKNFQRFKGYGQFTQSAISVNRTIKIWRQNRIICLFLHLFLSGNANVNDDKI